MKRHSKSTQLNCFSPPVMVATLLIEVSLLAYTVWRYKMTVLTRLVATVLVALATFQLAEYFVCTGAAGHVVQWSRVGFVAITVLPPLGLHILHELAGKPNRRLVGAAYLSMAGFIGFFLSYQAAFTGHQCTGNYVIFQHANNVGNIYTLYYYGWLLTALSLGFRWLGEMKVKGLKAHRSADAVRGMIAGYLVFLVPTTVINTLNPATIQGIPSIMCGFAVLFALILVMYVMPRAAESKETETKEVIA
jgi:hypothetical protein